MFNDFQFDNNNNSLWTSFINLTSRNFAGYINNTSTQPTVAKTGDFVNSGYKGLLI